jgi:hypothetical protein
MRTLDDCGALILPGRGAGAGSRPQPAFPVLRRVEQRGRQHPLRIPERVYKFSIKSKTYMKPTPSTANFRGSRCSR